MDYRLLWSLVVCICFVLFSLFVLLLSSSSMGRLAKWAFGWAEIIGYYLINFN